MTTKEHNAKLEQKRKEREKKDSEDSPTEKRELVMHGAKLKCEFASGLGELKVTSNEILLQEKLIATEGDGNNMVNLHFKGTCGHPKWRAKSMTPPPCMSVIKLSPWQNLGTGFWQEQKVLVKESCITCNPDFNSAVASPIPKVERILTPKEPPVGKYFIKGWWTNHKDEPIKRAIYGQKLRFHVEMDKNFVKPNEIVFFSLYDDDSNPYNKDTKKADDHIPLIHLENKEPYTFEKIKSDYKVIIEFSTTDNLEYWTKQLDEDRIFELYFRCSYNGKVGAENVELPIKPKDYLKLGTIVIDRYKMPGLNPAGTDIADDMAFGTGSKHSQPIYPEEKVTQYKEEYTLSGFSTSKHSVFSNAIDFDIKPFIKDEVEEKEKPRFSILVEQTQDNLKAPPRRDLLKSLNFDIANQNKNRRAKYSRDECYNTSYKIKIPLYFTQLEIPISTGFNVRVFDKLLDDNKLFWNFKNTAEFYFARSEMQDNFDRLVAKFQRNEGGIYEDPIMTKHALERSETNEYCQKVEDYIAEQLKTNFKKLEEVEDAEPYFFTGYIGKKAIFKNKTKNRMDLKDEFSKPTYSYGSWYQTPVKATDGLTIALNDIWASEVLLKQVVFDGDDYVARYEVTLWDHFGLDLPDMEKIFNVIPSVGEVFVCWFILQHLRGYKPFITKMTFKKEFKGNINQNKPIRPAKSKSNINLNIPYEYGRIM